MHHQKINFNALKLLLSFWSLKCHCPSTVYSYFWRLSEVGSISKNGDSHILMLNFGSTTQTMKLIICFCSKIYVTRLSPGDPRVQTLPLLWMIHDRIQGIQNSDTSAQILTGQTVIAWCECVHICFCACSVACCTVHHKWKGNGKLK